MSSPDDRCPHPDLIDNLKRDAVDIQLQLGGFTTPELDTLVVYARGVTRLIEEELRSRGERVVTEGPDLDPNHLRQLATLIEQRRDERLAKLAEVAEQPALGAYRGR
jgi:hypothetical protein